MPGIYTVLIHHFKLHLVCWSAQKHIHVQFQLSIDDQRLLQQAIQGTSFFPIDQRH